MGQGQRVKDNPTDQKPQAKNRTSSGVLCSCPDHHHENHSSPASVAGKYAALNFGYDRNRLVFDNCICQKCQN